MKTNTARVEEINQDIPKFRNAIERQTQTHVDMIVVTPETWDQWANPNGTKVGPNSEDGFQRAISRNQNVREVAEVIKRDRVIPGQVVIGVYLDKLWLIDGQHRREAFFEAVKSGIPSAYMDIKYEWFDSWADMASRYVELQRKICGHKADDMLKGLEFSTPSLQLLRQKCPFVGYTRLRGSAEHKARLSVSGVLKAWFGSRSEAPNSAGPGTYDASKVFSIEDANQLSAFLRLAESAWTFHPNYWPLWGQLNMTVCMWLYRRCVLSVTEGFPSMTAEQFSSCLASLPTAKIGQSFMYVQFLNRKGFADRGPVYSEIVKSFTSALRTEHKARVKFPEPPWTRLF